MSKVNIKTHFKNFISNIPLLISSSVVFVLIGFTRSIREIVFLGLILLALCVYSFFKTRRIESLKKQFGDKNASFLAVVFSGIVYMDIYNTLHDCIPGIIKAIPIIPPEVTLSLVILGLCTIGFYSLYIFSQCFISVLTPFKCLLVKYKKQLLILFAIYCIGIVPIIRANFNYIDDIARVNYGYNLTGDFSRYFSTFCANFIHGNTWLTDISPLPQIIAVFVLAFTGIVVIDIFSELLSKKDSCNLLAVISLVPLGLSPYFLQCLSYKYDAPYMALSVFAAVAPIVYYKNTAIKYGLAVFAGTIVVCTTYQASSGIFPILTILLALFMWIKKDNIKNILTFVFTSLCGYASGLIVFKYLLMTPNDSSFISSKFSVSTIIKNISTYFDYIFKDFTIIWLLLIVLIVVSFIIILVSLSKQNRIATALLAVVSISLMLILSFGAYLILENPSVEPRAMYGVTVLVSLLSVSVALTNKIAFGKAVTFLLSWLFFVFAFTYGNALNVQKEYTDFRIEQAISDLKDIEVLNNENSVSVQVEGTVDFAPSVNEMINNYKVLERLVPVLFSDGRYTYKGDVQLINNYYLNITREDSSDLTELNLPVIKDTKYHTIKASDQHILIELK
ncbi:MAG: glucosyltransferase domain-containing protein [Ruminococcus sp.]|nr:glucosyltransferase domain-containing protein [Ruminococcus sp.]